ncbi:COesterase domain-containing protein [Mycena venus]|uniref:COesterase domain-containing protein n=1 Tax=Mycena venus TaxID=2733690 RepID=A0A8H6XI78_9AGAR|nr:COesterase domain-containing protein [Mycena venus]
MNEDNISVHDASPRTQVQGKRGAWYTGEEDWYLFINSLHQKCAQASYLKQCQARSEGALAWRHSLSAFRPRPPCYDIEDAREQRKTLYWLAVGLRLVNRVFYTTSMNVLRSIYLPLYDSLIRPPYTSDPFPFTSHISPPQSKLPTSQSSQSRHPSLSSLQRETPILDLFIALKVREDVWADDSDLYLSRAARLHGPLLPDAHTRLEDLSTPTSVVLRSAASYAALTQRLAASSRSSSSGSSFWRTLGGKGKARASPPSTPLPSQKVTIHPLPFSAPLHILLVAPRRARLNERWFINGWYDTRSG